MTAKNVSECILNDILLYIDWCLAQLSSERLFSLDKLQLSRRNLLLVEVFDAQKMRLGPSEYSFIWKLGYCRLFSPYEVIVPYASLIHCAEKRVGHRNTSGECIAYNDMAIFEVLHIKVKDHKG